MPPKITVTRQQVLDAAFEIVRAEGLDRLSARSVAEALGCSTQPIYRAYGSMSQLHEDVFDRATQVALEYFTGADDAPPLLSVGYGNLRFAQQDPHLYRLVAGASHVVRDLVRGAAPPAFILERMRQLPELACMDGDQLRRIHTLLWFFSQGLATVFEVDLDDDPMPMAREYLSLAGHAVIAWEKGRVVS